MSGNAYRDLIAAYVDRNFGDHGLLVYTEVVVGKSIIGKRRTVDVFVRRKDGPEALAIECKYQASSGTTDEKIPYALQDLDAMWVPGCLVYAGSGWSKGVLHTLEGSRRAAFCEPGLELERTGKTVELDHIVGATFGLWDIVVADSRRFDPISWQSLPAAPLGRAKPKAQKTSSGKTG